MKSCAFMFLLSTSMFASLPDNSICQFFMSAHAEGRIYSPGLVTMGLLQPEEMVRVIIASCINSENGQEVLAIAQQSAFQENNKLISNPEYGIFAPGYTITYVNVSDAQQDGYTSTFIIENSLGDNSVKMRLQIQRNTNNTIQFFTLKMTQKMSNPSEEMHTGIWLSESAHKKLKIISWGKASGFINQGQTTWGNINSYIRENKWNLPRHTSLWQD